MAKKKERTAGNSFNFNDTDSEYRFQVKKKFPWWILLLLLIPILLIVAAILLAKCLLFKPEFPKVNYPGISKNPLSLYPEEPCGGATDSGGDEGVIKPVKMGQNSGTFLFEYNTYSAEDRITIYNGKEPKGTPIFQYEGGTNGLLSQKVDFNSSDGYISVVVEGIESGTIWEFVVNCPEKGEASPPSKKKTVAPPVIKPCNEVTQSGSNRPESFVFEMGQEGGSFVFEYNTGNLYGDLIIIYDGENNRAKEIFRYDGTTYEPEKAVVNFTGTKVYIEVHPDQDENTEWEILAHCPQ